MNVMALFNALPGSVAQGLIWGVMAIGVYMTYKVLDFADLTVDGSIATGGATAVMLMLSGQNVVVALIGATIAGMLAGGITIFIWKFVVRKLCAGTVLDIYELLPAFIVGLIVIVVVSLLTPAPSLEITNAYEEVKENCKGF